MGTEEIKKNDETTLLTTSFDFISYNTRMCIMHYSIQLVEYHFRNWYNYSRYMFTTKIDPATACTTITDCTQNVCHSDGASSATYVPLCAMCNTGKAGLIASS